MATLRRIVFPISLPGILTVVIFSFSLVVNEFVYAVSFITSSEQPDDLGRGPTELIRGDVFYWGALMAATLIPSIPLALLYNVVPRPLHRRLHRRGLPLARKEDRMADTGRTP